MKPGKWMTASLSLSLIDQYVKEQVEERFCTGDEKKIAGSRIVWRRVENRGFALNLLDARPELVQKSSLAAVLLSGAYSSAVFLRKGHFFQKTGAMLLLGGALSNLYDRIWRGYVVDYIGFQTRWKKLTEITYNFGDFFIFSGMGMLLASCLKEKKK